MRIIKRFFDLREQKIKSIDKLVDALKLSNKYHSELLQELQQAHKQRINDNALFMDTMKTFIEKIESALRMQATIEFDRLELDKKTVEAFTPTPDDARY